MADLPSLSDYQQTCREKLRYSDMDRQGHVNNAVYSTLFEAGRVEFMYDGNSPLHDPGCGLVLVKLEIDFVTEMSWPGHVEIGTRLVSLGRSSMRSDQAIFQNGNCMAIARNTVVQMNQSTRKSQPISDDLRARLSELLAAPS
ncbi:acyl-CoA thioesterase [Paracoccus tegillarcae]|uniref:Thioesterase n=1 Tax=Paracoccus tegillarcae TaxID=1529068 RepID=A0A2K9EZJ7_9RHOB|nr:thioesterase family protein [Paracoccus tegillarcae]AUH34734.1 thioesterase [Paracoccus tegillarcae]